MRGAHHDEVGALALDDVVQRTRRRGVGDDGGARVQARLAHLSGDAADELVVQARLVLLGPVEADAAVEGIDVQGDQLAAARRLEHPGEGERIGSALVAVDARHDAREGRHDATSSCAWRRDGGPRWAPTSGPAPAPGTRRCG